jgi:hypothetical protein
MRFGNNWMGFGHCVLARREHSGNFVGFYEKVIKAYKNPCSLISRLRHDYELFMNSLGDLYPPRVQIYVGELKAG